MTNKKLQFEIEKLRIKLEALDAKERVLRDKLVRLVRGRSFKVLSERYNGQVYGRSKPKLKGKILKSHSRFPQIFFNDWTKRIEIFPTGRKSVIAVKDVEFLGERTTDSKPVSQEGK